MEKKKLVGFIEVVVPTKRVKGWDGLPMILTYWVLQKKILERKQSYAYF